MFKILRYVAYFAGAATAISLVAIACAPAILSSPWGQQRILNHLNHSLKSGTLSFDDLELSWQGPQKIHNLVVKDRSGRTVIQIESAESQTTLFHFLLENFKPAHLRLTQFNASIVPDPIKRTTNLEEILGMVLFPFPILDSKTIEISGADVALTNNPDDLNVTASGKTQYGELSGNFNLELHQKLACQHISAAVDHFPVALLDVLLSIQDPSKQGVLLTLLGETIDLNAYESCAHNRADFKIKAHSPYVDAELSGLYDADRIALTSPASIHLKLTPEFNRAIARSSAKQWNLGETVELFLTMSQLDFPLAFLSNGLDAKDLQSWKIQSELHIPKAVVLNLQQSDLNATFQDLNLKIDTPSVNGQQFLVHVQGAISMAKDTVHFDLSSLFPKPDQMTNVRRSLASPSDIQVAFSDLPSSVLDFLLGTKLWFKSTLGEEVTFKLISPDHNLRALQLSLQSANLNITNMALNFDQDLVLGQNLLSQNLSGRVTAERIDFPQTEPFSQLTKVAIPWKLNGNQKNLEATFSAQTQIQGMQGTGSIDGKVAISRLSSDNPHIEFSSKGRQVPVKLLQLLTSRSEISPLFGDTIEMDVAAKLDKMNGDIQADLIGGLGKAKLNSKLREGILTLEEPFVASFTATPELGSRVLGKAMPIFKGLLSAQNPITITIDPAEFRAPLSTLDMSDIQIGKAVIDAGKMSFSNTGELEKLMGLLQIQSRGKERTLWATPLILSMHDGLLTVSRMDMLIMDRYHLAVWGTVDFAKDNVDMVIGIPGQTLSYALQIPKMDKEMMLQLPLRGKIRNAKIDQGKAATRIAAILAKQKEGKEGFVLGAVLDLANGKQAKVPKPTTTPFPWGDLQMAEPADFGNDDAPRKKRNKDVKDLEKSASKLLNKLLG